MPETDPESVPGGREIREAYKRSLQARQEYRRAVGSDVEGWAHQQLHDATMDYFDALRPLLQSANATSDLWEGVELWPVDYVTEPVAGCPDCGFSSDDLSHTGALCPDCEAADDREAGILQRMAMPVRGEDGQPEFEYATGLQTLDDLRLDVEVHETEYSDALGSSTSRTVQKRLLEPEQLIAVLDALDEAMQQLDLLVNIDDTLPKGGLGGASA